MTTIKRIDVYEENKAQEVTYYLINGALARSNEGGPLQEPVLVSSLEPLTQDLLRYQIGLLTEIDLYEKMIGADIARDQFSLRYRLCSLIESHKFLRQENVKRSDQRRAEMAEARELGRKQGFEAITKGEFFSREDLKRMTLQQLSELLQD